MLTPWTVGGWQKCGVDGRGITGVLGPRYRRILTKSLRKRVQNRHLLFKSQLISIFIFITDRKKG